MFYRAYTLSRIQHYFESIETKIIAYDPKRHPQSYKTFWNELATWAKKVQDAYTPTVLRCIDRQVLVYGHPQIDVPLISSNVWVDNKTLGAIILNTKVLAIGMESGELKNPDICWIGTRSAIARVLLFFTAPTPHSTIDKEIYKNWKRVLWTILQQINMTPKQHDMMDIALEIYYYTRYYNIDIGKVTAKLDKKLTEQYLQLIGYRNVSILPLVIMAVLPQITSPTAAQSFLVGSLGTMGYLYLVTSLDTLVQYLTGYDLFKDVGAILDTKKMDAELVKAERLIKYHPVWKK